MYILNVYPYPVYLGVKLDTRLTLKSQLKDIKKKANNLLKLLKRLASTSWGADKGTLWQLYTWDMSVP